MDSNLIPFIVFGLTASITPGPNNLLAANLGASQGYKRSISFLVGIASGVTLIFVLAGFGLSKLLQSHQFLLTSLKYLGVCYMLYLGFSPLLKSSYKKKTKLKLTYNFATGFILQAINPKLLINGAVTYSIFHKEIGQNTQAVILSALFLGILCYACISIWNLIGHILTQKFNSRNFSFVFNLVMFLLLLYIGLTILFT